MDLLFKRYASPFLMLDEMIASNRFYEFIVELGEIRQEEAEEEQDKLLWHFWLHNVEGKPFRAWKEENSVPDKAEDMQAEEMGATIRDSKSILDGFMPS